MGQLPESYAALGQQIFDSMQDNASVTQATDVAQAVWRMVHDADAPSRLPAGEDAPRWRRPVIALSEGNMRDLSVRRWVRKLPLRFMVGEYYPCQDRTDNMSCYTIYGRGIY